MAKRKLHPKEIRLVVPVRRLRKDGRLRKGTKMHVARHTVNGNIEKMCNHMPLDLLETYYFPFIRFIYDAAPMCAACVATMEVEGMNTPVSNTGVNSTPGGTNVAE